MTIPTSPTNMNPANRDPMLNVLSSLGWSALAALILNGPPATSWTYPIGWICAGIAVTRMGDAIRTWYWTPAQPRDEGKGLDL